MGTLTAVVVVVVSMVVLDEEDEVLPDGATLFPGVTIFKILLILLLGTLGLTPPVGFTILDRLP